MLPGLSGRELMARLIDSISTGVPESSRRWFMKVGETISTPAPWSASSICVRSRERAVSSSYGFSRNPEMR